MNKIFFIFTTFFSFILCQFVEIDCKIDQRRIANDNKFLLQDLCRNIDQYYKSNVFAPDAQDIEIPIQITFAIENLNKSDNQYSVSTKILAKSTIDQIFFSKSAEFPINSTKNLVLSQVYNPFTSLLDYYAFLFIAMELDTWQKMGGDVYFSKALSLSSYALDQPDNTGWDDRYEEVKKNKENLYLRNLRYYFFEAFDEYNKKDYSIKKIKLSLNTFFENLYSLSDKYGREKFTINFLKAYANEIAMLSLESDMDEPLLFLINYDSENKKIYNTKLQQIYLKTN